MENNSFFKRLILKFAAANESVVAFSLYDGKQVTYVSYPQFSEDILRAASYFETNNIHRQHIAIVAPNSYTWIVTYYAILVTGNIVVLIDHHLPVELVQKQCQQADVTVVCAEKLAKKERRNDSIKWVSFSELSSENTLSLDSVWQHQPQDTVVMMFTSGTSGKSKVVEFSFDNMQSYFSDLDEIFHNDYNNLLLTAPLHHIMGLTSVLARLQRLYCVCIGRGVQYMIWDMPILNPSILQMPPTVLESMVKLLKQSKTPEAQQRYIGNNLKRISVGGAASKHELCRYMIKLGIIVETGYGMTESTGAGTWCEWDVHNISTIGKPYGNTQIRIKAGELLLKGPSVMKGYYKDPEETAKVIVDGWLHTGDMGYCDENGYYYITGRKKNVIILSNGENVNPEEIEAAFGACTSIEECLVYSDGKGICADVFANDPDSAAAYIKNYNESMPMYRQVYKVNYSSEPLPKTGSGKIKRKENK